MKLFLLSVVTLALYSNRTCKKDNVNSQCFKGRLEIKALCSNYTIKLVEGNLDPSRIEARWTDEHTGKTYTNVFALGSPCTFPESINEGDEFYFRVADAQQDCIVCQAYYPKPSKSLSIKVVEKCK